MTGGASGLGKATAERFIRKGSKVVICDLHSSHGEGLAKELGEDATFIPTDVTSPDDVSTALNVVKEKYKKLDVLVNCAGIPYNNMVYNPDHRTPHDLGDFEKVINVSRFLVAYLVQICPNHLFLYAHKIIEHNVLKYSVYFR